MTLFLHSWDFNSALPAPHSSSLQDLCSAEMSQTDLFHGPVVFTDPQAYQTDELS